MILPECRWMWDGIEGADSLVINPHKWLGAAFDCSLYYVRDPQHLIRVMSTNPSFLQSAVDDEVKNLRDWGIPLGRRFRALKLWLLIRANGVAGSPGPPPPRPRQCPMARRTRSPNTRTGASSPPFTCKPSASATNHPAYRTRRSTSHTRAWCDRDQPLRRRLPDPGHPRRSLDGPRQHRRHPDRTRARRRAVDRRCDRPLRMRLTHDDLKRWSETPMPVSIDELPCDLRRPQGRRCPACLRVARNLARSPDSDGRRRSGDDPGSAGERRRGRRSLRRSALRRGEIGDADAASRRSWASNVSWA